MFSFPFWIITSLLSAVIVIYRKVKIKQVPFSKTYLFVWDACGMKLAINMNTMIFVSRFPALSLSSG